MPEPFYIYILYMICKRIFLGWWSLSFMANQPLKGHWVSNSDIYIYTYVYFGSISSLIQISLNIIDILCPHIFFWIRSNSRITFIVKRSFFQAAVTSILLYGCTTWTLTKRLEKKLDGNYTRMLRAILNKSWQQHPTRHQLYGHLPPITKTIQVRRTRHAGHCWRSRDELIRDVLLWIPTHGRAKAGRPARTYIQQLCEDTGCCPEDLPRAMNDREEWRKRVRDIRAASTIWWWWWWLSIVVCIPSTFCPTLGHHQGRIYYKSDVTFVLAYYHYVRASLPLKIMAFAFKWVSIISVSS